MKSTLLLSTIVLLSGGIALLVATASSHSRAADPIKPLDAYQDELLDLAFKSATALPIKPHIKSRSRQQEAVVETCLELDQPQRALGYIEQMATWRRGACYADLAFYCARHGDAATARQDAELARRISETPEEEDAQDWHRDRIRARIARTYAWLGEMDQAARLEAGVADSESGKAGAVEAMHADAEVFRKDIEALDRAAATSNFDRLQAALETCAQLFDRFYAHPERRSLVEEKIKSSWSRLPVMVRMNSMLELAGFALAHADRKKALDLANEAQLIMDGVTWTPEDHVPLMARLAGVRHRAGDEEGARVQIEAALALFEAERDKIVDIYRAGVLRPIAEVYRTMGDTPAASRIYTRAVEAGVENENSRPRAEDLSATCRSMALNKVEPDAGLRARLRRICDGLGPPW